MWIVECSRPRGCLALVKLWKTCRRIPSMCVEKAEKSFLHRRGGPGAPGRQINLSHLAPAITRKSSEMVTQKVDAILHRTSNYVEVLWCTCVTSVGFCRDRGMQPRFFRMVFRVCSVILILLVIVSVEAKLSENKVKCLAESFTRINRFVAL